MEVKVFQYSIILVDIPTQGSLTKFLQGTADGMAVDAFQINYHMKHAHSSFNMVLKTRTLPRQNKLNVAIAEHTV